MQAGVGAIARRLKKGDRFCLRGRGQGGSFAEMTSTKRVVHPRTKALGVGLRLLAFDHEASRISVALAW